MGKAINQWHVLFSPDNGPWKVAQNLLDYQHWYIYNTKTCASKKIGHIGGRVNNYDKAIAEATARNDALNEITLGCGCGCGAVLTVEGGIATLEGGGTEGKVSVPVTDIKIEDHVAWLDRVNFVFVDTNQQETRLLAIIERVKHAA